MLFLADDDRLRDILPESFNEFFDNIMNLIILVLDPIFTKKICSRDNRIGVFGSYKNGGKAFLTELSKQFSAAGYGIITGHGYFKPKAKKISPLSNVIPPQVNKLRETFRIPSFVFYDHYTRLVNKGIFHLTDSRGEGTEAIGCFKRGIPMAGFIITKRIWSKKAWCNFLIRNEKFVECICPDDTLCFYPSLAPYCPFYEEVNVPWEIKQLFLTKDNRLFAVTNPDHITNFFKDAKSVGDKVTDFSLLS